MMMVKLKYTVPRSGFSVPGFVLDALCMRPNKHRTQNTEHIWIGILLSMLIFPVTGMAQGVIDRNHVPSSERVDPFERRSDVIDGNNIRATLTNWAQTANSGNPGDFLYEWPKNTNRIYIALSQLWVGAEVKDENGEDLWIVEVSDFRRNPVDENRSWTFEPIKGYVNPAGSALGIAQSDEPESWPASWPDKLSDADDPGWPGSWNGFFGKNSFNADQEFFYKVGDDQYDRYPNYFPDDTDLSRKGLASSLKCGPWPGARFSLMTLFSPTRDQK